MSHPGAIGCKVSYLEGFNGKKGGWSFGGTFLDTCQLDANIYQQALFESFSIKVIFIMTNYDH